jgi:hypothetical protein
MVHDTLCIVSVAIVRVASWGEGKGERGKGQERRAREGRETNELRVGRVVDVNNVESSGTGRSWSQQRRDNQTAH